MIEIKCSNCGFELPEDSKFCSECGAEQDLSFFCMKCGTKVLYGEKFCPNCGESFEKRKITTSDIKTFVIGTEADRKRRAKTVKNQVNRVEEAIRNKKKQMDENRLKREAEVHVKWREDEKARKEAERDEQDREWNQKVRNANGDGGVLQFSQGVANIPIRDYDPSKDYTPISMWGYFLYSIVFAMPVIGWIIALVFALGGTNNINLRNYARSMFCYAIITFFIVSWTIGNMIADLKEKIDTLEGYNLEMRNELEILDEDYFG